MMMRVSDMVVFGQSDVVSIMHTLSPGKLSFLVSWQTLIPRLRDGNETEELTQLGLMAADSSGRFVLLRSFSNHIFDISKCIKH